MSDGLHLSRLATTDGDLSGNAPLSWWNNVTWTIEEIDCAFDNLSERTKSLVYNIIEEVKLECADAVTKKRYREAFVFIMENSRFPKPMTAMRASDGFSFLDGHHRLAAFTDLQKIPVAAFTSLNFEKPMTLQNVWIGRHVDGELPIVE